MEINEQNFYSLSFISNTHQYDKLVLIFICKAINMIYLPINFKMDFAGNEKRRDKAKQPTMCT